MPDRPESRERTETDDSLRTERTKTDSELRKAQGSLESTTRATVGAARDRADAVVRESRRRQDAGDATLDAEGRAGLAGERRREDEALAEERAGVDAAAERERLARELALAGLLSVEREATDLRLKVERLHSDEALIAREDFFAMVSHDLRTLLGGIALSAAFVDRLSRTDQPIRDVQRHAANIQRFTARMNRLIGDLIDVASIEAGKLSVEPTRYDATQLIRESLETFQAAAAAHGLSLESDVTDHPALARFDHDRIMQVLSNLVGNALKFTPAGGRITLRVRPHGDEVHFSVEDTGEGIPADRLGSIFDRFSQVQRSDRRGLGLGLFISRCIVEAHGGRIWAESEVGRGTTVTFTLPAERSVDVEA